MLDGLFGIPQDKIVVLLHQPSVWRNHKADGLATQGHLVQTDRIDMMTGTRKTREDIRGFWFQK